MATISRLLIWSLLVIGATNLARRVEDGQFEREYSRIYMGLLLALALLVILAIALLLGNGVAKRNRAKR